MDFVKIFQSDRGISERTVAFSPQLPQYIGGYDPAIPKMPGQDHMGTAYHMGSELLANGDVVFRMYAKGAASVTATVRGKPPVTLAENADGVFEGTLPYDPDFAGPHNVDFQIDGVSVINPYSPIWFSMNRPANYVEIPDPETAGYLALREDIPHGSVTKELFKSEAIGSFARCLVYTPPGYEKGGEYPVLYLQHGATENETCWVYAGKAPYIMDNLIAEGKCVPFVIVMNDGMLRAPHAPARFEYSDFEKLLTEECRLFIESKYRVKTDKWSRAIAGLSMGSIQACSFGMRHPELFGYIGLFSGFMRKPGGDYSKECSPHLEAMKNSGQFARDYRIFFRSVGDKDELVKTFCEDDGYCARLGADKLPNYVRHIYPGQTHEWGAWRRAFHDFAQVIFR